MSVDDEQDDTLTEYEDDYLVCDWCGRYFENDGGGLYCSADCEDAANGAEW